MYPSMAFVIHLHIAVFHELGVGLSNCTVPYRAHWQWPTIYPFIVVNRGL